MNRSGEMGRVENTLLLGVKMSLRVVALATLIAGLWSTTFGFSSWLYSWAEDESAVEMQFKQLQLNLEERGFTVKLEPPPQEGAYGLLETSTRTIWIHPIVSELGIALPVLIHEGVHAAQVCAGNGVVAALNLDIAPPNSTRPFFLRYHSYRRNIEAEAYTVQVQPDAYERVNQLLEQHC